jgi:hypothetical protein
LSERVPALGGSTFQRELEGLRFFDSALLGARFISVEVISLSLAPQGGGADTERLCRIL